MAEPVTPDRLRQLQTVGAVTQEELAAYDAQLMDHARKSDRSAYTLTCVRRMVQCHQTDVHMQQVAEIYKARGFKVSFARSGSDQREGDWPASVTVAW